LRDADSFAAAVQARRELLMGPLNRLLEQDREANPRLAIRNYNRLVRQVNALLEEKRANLPVPPNVPGSLGDIFELN
jgi:hypothetical protein